MEALFVALLLVLQLPIALQNCVCSSLKTRKIHALVLRCGVASNLLYGGQFGRALSAFLKLVQQRCLLFLSWTNSGAGQGVGRPCQVHSFREDDGEDFLSFVFELL